MSNANLAFLEKVAKKMPHFTEPDRASTEKKAGMQDALLWLAKNRRAVTAGGAGLGAGLGAMNAEEGQRMGGALRGGLLGGALGAGAGYGSKGVLQSQLDKKLNALRGTTPLASRAGEAAKRLGQSPVSAAAAAPAQPLLPFGEGAAPLGAAVPAPISAAVPPALGGSPLQIRRNMGRLLDANTPLARKRLAGLGLTPEAVQGLSPEQQWQLRATGRLVNAAALTSKPAFLEGVERYFAKTAGAKEAFAARVGLPAAAVGEELWKAAMELRKRAGDGFDPEAEQKRIDAATAAERARFQASEAARIEAINRRAKTRAYGGGIPDQKAQAQLIEARNALAKAKASGNPARVIEARNTLAAAERQVPNTPSVRGGLAQEGPQAVASEAKEIQQEMKQRPAQKAEKAWQAADRGGEHRPEGQRPFDPMNYLRQKWAPVGEDLQKLPQDIREKGWLGGLGGFAQEHPYATGVGALGAGGLAYAVHRMLSQKQPKPKRRTA